jgi:4-hydroxy-tetrahydrodipicolinate synthase
MDLGVDACLIVTPYFIKPTQEGLYQHYASIAEKVAIPIILYNVSSRTACDLLPETVERLSSISNIVGIKEANSDLSRGRELLERCQGNIDLYSGDDASALAFMLQGGKGVISVTANIAPKMMHEMCEAALDKNLKMAGELNAKLMPLHKSLFLESNPIPVKWALSEMGKISSFIRLPLTTLSTDAQTKLKEAMKESGVLQ